MDAYKILEENNLTRMLKPVKYCTPTFRNSEMVTEFLRDIVLSNKKVRIIGDCDVDGLMCNLVMYEGLTQLGAQNVDIFNYVHRTHKLDPVAVQECIQRKYDYCIICDCGSHDISLIRMLLNYDIRVILLDHHQTLTRYEDFDEMGHIAVINTTLEEQKYCLSAGALCFCVMDALFNSFNRDASILSAYALISLFADCMNMSDDLNRSIYFYATSIPKDELPANVRMFMNDYQLLNNRFITFWMAPRINAMFRSENLAVLNKLFFSKDSNAVDKSKCLQFINSKYEEIRELINRVTDLIEIEDAGGIVIGNLQSVNKHYNVDYYKLWNYTGLVANIISSNYSKPAFVYCRQENGYKGSVRDIFGRDYLTTFRQICRADGHKPAFGCYIAALDFEDFIFNLRRLAKRMAIVSPNNKPVIIDYRYNNPDPGLIEDIGLMNEFAGQDVPVILLQKQLIGNIKEVKTKYNYKYNWGDYYIQSQYAIGFGSMMLLRPTRSFKTKLLVQ